MPTVGASAAPTVCSSSLLLSSRTYLTSTRRLEVGVDDLFFVVAGLARLLGAGVLALRGRRLCRGLHEGLQLLGEVAALLLELVLADVAVKRLLSRGDGVLKRLLLLVGRAFRVAQGLLRLEPEAVQFVLRLGQLADLLVLVGVGLGLLDHPVDLVLAEGGRVLDGDGCFL